MTAALERRRERVEALRKGKSWERRGCNLLVARAEIRSGQDDGAPIVFVGYASLFGVPYSVGDFTETVEPGTFTRTLRESPDVVFRIEHQGLPLARTARAGSPGTLHLEETGIGLLVRAEFARDDDDAQRLKMKMDRGLVDEMSFAFRCTSDTWNSDYTDRKIRGVTLSGGDVSAVTFAASPTTGDTTSIREARAGKYAAHQLAELGSKGEAFANPNGHWSYPTHDRDDLEKAIHDVGRSGASHNSVRVYLMKRAKEMGLSHLIPVNWASDGSARARGWVNLNAARQEIDVMRAAADRPPRLRAIEDQLCESCGGTGKESGRPCPKCEGTGEVPADAPRSRAPLGHPVDPHARLRSLVRGRRLTRGDELRLLQGRYR
jgi:HK97 family phage prohead protease